MIKNLLGQRFGRLVVISRDGSDGRGRARWLCKCDCGGICTVSASNLKNQHTKSCGCLKKRELTGMRFGSLTVLGRSELRISRGERSSPTWVCRCDCGATVYRATDTLTNGDLNMCTDCAGRYAAEKMRENAGFVGGTQICKITDMRPTAANSSGVRGVTLDKHSGKWRAMIIFRGERHHLGLFSAFDDAVKARKQAEEKYFKKFLRENKY